MSTPQPDVLTLAVRQALLSPKEREVFHLLGQGMSCKEIAGSLGKSVKTVDAQCQAIKNKMGLRDMRAVVVAAVRMSAVKR